jgi:hypothetical protein
MAKRQKPQQPPKANEVFKDSRTQDVASPRAKATGHKKKTADKWNQ